mgnify:CR=1 FL=1
MRLPEPRKYLSAMPSENPAERENKKRQPGSYSVLSFVNVRNLVGYGWI